MRAAAAVFCLVFACVGPVKAECCFGDVTLGGSVAADSTDKRTFTLCPGATIVGVMADREKKKLSITVRDPDGDAICSEGPSNNPRCAVHVSKGGKGVYSVRVKNPSDDMISYQLSCSGG